MNFFAMAFFALGVWLLGMTLPQPYSQGVAVASGIAALIAAIMLLRRVYISLTE